MSLYFLKKAAKPKIDYFQTPFRVLPEFCEVFTAVGRP
jgi:hypothetical protein